jgi:hypothetical protein
VDVFVQLGLHELVLWNAEGAKLRLLRTHTPRFKKGSRVVGLYYQPPEERPAGAIE